MIPEGYNVSLQSSNFFGGNENKCQNEYNSQHKTIHVYCVSIFGGTDLKQKGRKKNMQDFIIELRERIETLEKNQEALEERVSELEDRLSEFEDSLEEIDDQMDDVQDAVDL